MKTPFAVPNFNRIDNKRHDCTVQLLLSLNVAVTSYRPQRINHHFRTKHHLLPAILYTVFFRLDRNLLSLIPHDAWCLLPPNYTDMHPTALARLYLIIFTTSIRLPARLAVQPFEQLHDSQSLLLLFLPISSLALLCSPLASETPALLLLLYPALEMALRSPGYVRPLYCPRTVQCVFLVRASLSI